MNERCEIHQADLSALIDGELDARDAIAAVDHVTDCGACREFWRSARALQDATSAEAGAEAGAEPLPPADGWRRIESTVQGEDRRSHRARPRTWAWRIAAMLVVGVGLLFALQPGSPQPGSPRDTGLEPGLAGTIEVQAGTRPMSERRFVEVTTELLRADPAYHAMMLDVMRQVVAPEGLPGTLREGAPASEDDPEGDEREPRRLPGGRVQTS